MIKIQCLNFGQWPNALILYSFIIDGIVKYAFTVLLIGCNTDFLIKLGC